MNSRRLPSLLFALALVAVTQGAAAQQAAIRVGGMCDRTGSTKIIGGEFCTGVADYIALVNRRGGVLGQKIEYTEIDHAYVVPRAVEAYERLKRDGVVAFFNYGVPTLQALAPYLMADKLPSFNSGTGLGEYVDGTTWPYIFPGTASYWSQAAVAMKYLKENGAKQGTKVAFIYYDNPAGREGRPMIEAIAAREGYVLRQYAVQPPALEMEPQVTEIVRDFKADWVIGSLFGAAPSRSIREFSKAGFPLNRFVSFVYGSGDADVADAGWEIAQGYVGLQFAALGRNLPVIQEILRMYRDEGKEPPKYIGSAYYNRGVLTAAIIVEGLRLAIRNHGLPVTGDKVRRGYEAIRSFNAEGLGPQLDITPQDHEGGGYLQVYQVKGSAWTLARDWMRADRDEVMALARKANAK